MEGSNVSPGRPPSSPATDLRVLVVDDATRSPLWKHLLPGAETSVPEDFTYFLDSTDKATWSAIILYVDMPLNAPKYNRGEMAARARPGIALAARALQEPQRFGCPILLASFEPEQSVQSVRLDLAKLLGREWLVGWVRLPCSGKELEEIVLQLLEKYRSKPDQYNERHALATKICQEDLHRENRRYRHAQGTFCAAVRLVLGGIETGHVPLEEGRKVLRQLAGRRKAIPDPSGVDYDFGLVQRLLALKRLDSNAEEVGEGGTKSADQTLQENKQDPSEKRRLLVIDDEYESAGWDLALSVLLPSWQIDFRENISILDDPNQYLDDYEIVLLDYRLGNEVATGLELIDRIRERNPFIPIVMFTGETQSMLFTAALARGATASFVKELADTADRDSEQYYRYFRRLCDELTMFEPAALKKLLNGWKAIFPLLQAAGVGQDKQARECLGVALNCIRRALFFFSYAAGVNGALGGDLDRLDPRQAERDTAYRLVAINLGRAIDEIVLAHGAKPFSSPTLVWIKNLQKQGKWRGGVTRLDKVRAWANENRHGDYAKSTKATPTARGMDHAPSTPVSLGQAPGYEKNQKIIEQVGDFVNRVASVWRCCCEYWGIGFPFVREAGAKVDSLIPRDGEQKPSLGDEPHGYRAVQGCVRFIIGHFLASGTADMSKAKDLWTLVQKDKDTFPTEDHGKVAVELAIEGFGAPPSTPSVVEGQERQLRHLLLVDDTAANDGWLRALECGLDGFTITHLGTPEELVPTVVSARAAEADIVLLDLRLPEPPSEQPQESVGLKLINGIRGGDRTDVPIVVFSADDDVLWARRCYRAGAQAYFPKSGQPLPLGPGADHADFYISYSTQLREILQLNGPKAQRAGLSGIRLRLSRAQRYRFLDGWASHPLRALVVPEMKDVLSKSIASRIRNETDLALNLAWIGEDVHGRSLWSWLMQGSSRVSEDEPSTAELEMITGLQGLAEFLLKLVGMLIISRQTFAADDPSVIALSKMMWSSLVDAVEQEQAPFSHLRLQNRKAFVERCRELGLLRNRAYHRKSGDGNNSALPTSFGVLRDITRELILQSAISEAQTLGSDNGVTTIAPELNAMLKPARRIKNIRNRISSELTGRVRGIAEAKRSWSESQAILTTRSKEIEELRSKGPLMQKEHSRLQKHIGVQMSNPWPRGVPAWLDALLSEFNQLQADLESLPAKEEDAKKACGVALQEERIAWEAYKKLLRDQSPGVDAYRLKMTRWQMVESWLEERELEEEAARLTGTTPQTCAWDGLSLDLENVVEECSRPGHEALLENVVKSVQSWVDGEPLRTVRKEDGIQP